MRMSQDIMKEVAFLGHSLLMGVIITCIYDCFLIIRRLIKHTIFLISIEDMIFWVICAISVFSMLYRENNGMLRWFAVGGAFLGMLLYKKTISGFLVKTISRILQKLFCRCRCLLEYILRPAVLVGNKAKQKYTGIRRVGSKIFKYIKNRLTACKKVLKIILCKR